MSIQLQNLSNEYNMLISQYQDTYQKYIDVINSDNNNFKTLNDSAFYGKELLDILNNTNVDNCQSACSSNSSLLDEVYLSIKNKISDKLFSILFYK